ncbi:MAG: putative transporter [Stenotrophomonas maltophilia]|nr:MAG: putative transporter [Stenotrophomonas maltophilia]
MPASPSPCLGNPALPSPALAWLFALASGLSVANVYYAQPLLDALAREFAIAPAHIGLVISATQAGSALALLLLVPLGDRLERRRLMLLQWLGLIAALLAVGLARSPGTLLAGMLAVGLLGTAMTQGLIAYAASAAPEAARGEWVGLAQGGVFIGLLLARVVAGAVSDLAGWRGVYLGAGGVLALLAWPLWQRLPVLPLPSQRLSYAALLGSLFSLLRSSRVLRVRGVLALLMFAVFSLFWSTLVLPLSAAPFNFSHTQIGAFGLVGALGALAAARAGRWVDRGRERAVSLGALLLLLAAWVPLAQLDSSAWVLLPGVLLLDLGGQALHVSNQSLILRGQPQAAGRLIGLYMLFYAVGSGLGALAGSLTYAYLGWSAVSLLGALLAGEWPVVEAADPRHLKEASGLVAAYLAWHLERSLRSLAYVER